MTTRFLHCPALLLVITTLFFTVARADENPDVAMITGLQGGVARMTPQGRQALAAFARLKRGDVVAADNSRIQLVYFETGRQEIWQGSGRLEVLATETRPFGLPDPVVKMLSSAMVKQIARTPTPDGQGRSGAIRTRAIASPEAIAKLENAYRKMRMEAVRGDLNPELFLLSGLFEMRELERVEQVIRDLQQARPGDVEIGFLASLYQKAIKNAREARGS